MEKTIFQQKLTWHGKAADGRFWDGQWESKIDHALMKSRIPSSLSGILQRIPRGARILEAGCGRGNIVKALLSAGYQAEGIDIAESTVHILQSRHLPVHRMDVRILEYPADSFDAYLSLGVVEHFFDESESRRILQEAVRVTRPGGRIFCSVPYTNCLRARYFKRRREQDPEINPANFYQRSYTADQFRGLFEGLPLKIEHIGYENPVKGITEELPALKWLRKLPFVLLITWLQEMTGCFDPFAHMICFELLNSKKIAVSAL